MWQAGIRATYKRGKNNFLILKHLELERSLLQTISNKTELYTM